MLITSSFKSLLVMSRSCYDKHADKELCMSGYFPGFGYGHRCICIGELCNNAGATGV